MEPTTPSALRDAVSRHADRAKHELQRLVAINSFTRNAPGVDANGAIAAALFRELGFVTESIPARNPHHGAHLVARRGESGATRGRILLVSHLDTVYPPDIEERHDFRWRDEGERIVGPGVADIKGGTIVLWLALRALADVAPHVLARAPFSVLLDAAEEEGSLDFPEIARREAGDDARACLVFECCNARPDGARTITVARRGAGRLVVEAHGRGAHAGSGHECGANAIRELARAIERIEALSRPDDGVTYNVGRIEGGEAVNTVPPWARAFVDIRARRVVDFEPAIAAVTAMAGEGSVRARSDGFVCTLAVERRPDYPPWPPNDGSEALAARALAVGARLGLALETEHRAGASDGNHVWQLVPTIDALGPCGRDIHCAIDDPARGKRQESIEAASLAERAWLTAALIEDLVYHPRS